MKRSFHIAVFAVATIALTHFALVDFCLGDRHGESSDRDGGRHRERYGRNSDRKEHLGPVDGVYKENCGACHFAYQAGLLPSTSWRTIISQLDNHFGESLDFAPETMAAITDYLMENCAERSRSERSVKIVRSLGNEVPIRVTEVPYVRQKHRKISSGVLQRPSIGSLSNCAACHTKAVQGIFDDDYVVIPK